MGAGDHQVRSMLFSYVTVEHESLRKVAIAVWTLEGTIYTVDEAQVVDQTLHVHEALVADVADSVSSVLTEKLRFILIYIIVMITFYLGLNFYFRSYKIKLGLNYD